MSKKEKVKQDLRAELKRLSGILSQLSFEAHKDLSDFGTLLEYAQYLENEIKYRVNKKIKLVRNLLGIPEDKEE